MDELKRLFAERALRYADVEAVDARIWARFGARRAPLFLDMSGFSRLSLDRGVTHFLALILRMRTLCCPIIARRGRLVRVEADNLFGHFDSPEIALAVAHSLMAACESDGAVRAQDDRIVISVGIGWGDVLDLDGHDVFGNEVNLASRLGEDLALGGEILVSEAVQQAVQVSASRHCVRVSGVDVAYWKLALGP
jgi:class 3 adenylate cyclase